MEKVYDSVIIGAGPAGITAAIYLKRANKDILLIEKATPGGQITKSSTVENYPGFVQISGPDLASKFYEQITNLDVSYKMGEVESIKKNETFEVLLKDEVIKSKSIILAVGKEPKNLKAKNSKNLVGSGISFCSLCDGSLYKKEDVAIVGGGNSALEEALYLASICKSVTILNRSDALRGDSVLINKVNEKENINVLFETSVKEFVGNNNKLDYLLIEKNGKEEKLDVKACFIFIGYKPATDFLSELDILDSTGYIEVDKNLETKIKGIYACGDCVKKSAYQIVTATSDGAIAAVNCIKGQEK